MTDFLLPLPTNLITMKLLFTNEDGNVKAGIKIHWIGILRGRTLNTIDENFRTVDIKQKSLQKN